MWVRVIGLCDPRPRLIKKNREKEKKKKSENTHITHLSISGESESFRTERSERRGGARRRGTGRERSPAPQTATLAAYFISHRKSSCILVTHLALGGLSFFVIFKVDHVSRPNTRLLGIDLRKRTMVLLGA